MCAVADAYDAMVCGLENRPPMSMSDALGELRREAGGQFDPGLVDRFEAVIRDETADLGVDPAAVAGLESFPGSRTDSPRRQGFHLMKTIDINDRDRQMLELLAQGASNRSIADSLGYREGTMRVYLHGLYKKLGVGNKTSAVIWYFDRLKVEGVASGTAGAEVEGPAPEECFGDIALRQDLHGALGAMGMFLGAYGRLWEVANRLKGAPRIPGSTAAGSSRACSGKRCSRAISPMPSASSTTTRWRACWWIRPRTACCSRACCASAAIPAPPTA